MELKRYLVLIILNYYFEHFLSKCHGKKMDHSYEISKSRRNIHSILLGFLLCAHMQISNIYVALATLSSCGKSILNDKGLRVVHVVNFLFSTFLGLLRRSLQKKVSHKVRIEKSGGWLLVGVRAGNNQQITESLGSPLGRGNCEVGNILDA